MAGPFRLVFATEPLSKIDCIITISFIRTAIVLRFCFIPFLSRSSYVIPKPLKGIGVSQSEGYRKRTSRY